MFSRKMTLKQQQEQVCYEILSELKSEWKELEIHLHETVDCIVTHEDHDLMERLYGTRFVHLAHLFMDSRTLLNDIEELENE